MSKELIENLRSVGRLWEDQAADRIEELEHQLDELRKQNKSLKESLIKWRQREWPNTDQRAVVEREFPVIAK